jgi:hypothetical protein
MSTHALYATVRLHGIATSNLSDGSTAPYVGTCTVWILPPGATTPNSHEVTSSATGAWSYDVDSDEAGYASGDWKYCIRVGVATHGATMDQSFRVGRSFAPEVPPTP